MIKKIKFKALKKTLVPAVNNNLIQITESLILKSIMLGYAHGIEDKPKTNELTDTEYNPDDYTWDKGIPFENAVNFFKSKIPMTKKEWNELEPQVRYRAFTVARLAQVDQIELVRKKLINALQKGQSRDTFIQEIKKAGLIDSAGLNSKNPRYWETVYRTNINSAYNAGRRMADNKFPKPKFYKFSALINSSRTTDICRKRHGIVKKADDPWWDSNTPTLHFNCRSSLISIYTNKNETDLPAKLPKPSKGFGGNPVERGSFLRLTEGMAKRAQEYNIFGDYMRMWLNIQGIDRQDVRFIDKTPKESADINRDIKTRMTDNGLMYDFSVRENGKVYISNSKLKSYKNGSKQQKAIIKKELDVINFLAKKGYTSYLLPDSVMRRQANPDAMINGLIFDIKTPDKASAKNIADNIRKAIKNEQANNFVIDCRKLTYNISLKQLSSQLSARKLKGLFLIIKDKEVHAWHLK